MYFFLLERECHSHTSQQSHPSGLEVKPLLEVLVECHLLMLSLYNNPASVIGDILLFQPAGVKECGY